MTFFGGYFTIYSTIKSIFCIFSVIKWYFQRKGLTDMDYFHETIKVPDQFLAWIYLQSENHINTVKKHWHRSIELSYMIKGSCLFEVNGRAFRANAGDIILINSCDVHGCQANYQSESDMISIIFPYSFLKAVFPAFNDYRYMIKSDSDAFRRLRKEFEEICPIFRTRHENSLYPLKLNSFFYEILYIIFADCKAPKPVPNSINSQKHIERCTEILDYIDNHYMENLSLQTLADTFSLSKEHLSRTFKTYMDTTFKKYLTSIRVHHAYQALVDTDLSILRIALDNGFSDARAFSSAFYTYYGETPLKYRKSIKNPDISHIKSAYLRTHGFL